MENIVLVFTRKLRLTCVLIFAEKPALFSSVLRPDAWRSSPYPRLTSSISSDFVGCTTKSDSSCVDMHWMTASLHLSYDSYSSNFMQALKKYASCCSYSVWPEIDHRATSLPHNLHDHQDDESCVLVLPTAHLGQWSTFQTHVLVDHVPPPVACPCPSQGS